MQGLVVDLMGSEVPSDRQIAKRVVAQIRSQFSISDEQKFSRIMHGVVSGRYEASADEMADIDAYEAHVLTAKALGAQALVDRDALSAAIAYEQAQTRLAQPENPEYLADADERATAQVVVDNVTAETVTLCEQREAYRQTNGGSVGAMQTDEEEEAGDAPPAGIPETRTGIGSESGGGSAG